MRSHTRVSLLACLALAAPAAAQTVLNVDHGFGMDDGAITPDGRYAVVRENTALTQARIYDLATGLQVGIAGCSNGTFSGPAQDCVAVTNTRAVVLGSCAMVLDLTNLAAPLLAEHLVGYAPQDVEITPNGTMAVVRGGASSPGFPGGLFVLDMATGALLASHPGEPGDTFTTTYTYDVDSVAVSDDHAVCLSIVTPNVSPRTRVTIWDLHPAGGGAPTVVYETTSGAPANRDQLGGPHDVAITPDGQYAAVRSEFAIGLYRLNGAASGRTWLKRPFGDPGPMGFTSMDSIEVTNSRVVSACLYDTGTTTGAQLDVFDIAGNQWYSRMRGEPHDLTITPAGTRTLVRTTEGVYLFDIASLPAGAHINPLARDETLTSTHTFFTAGYDSIVATNERAVAVARVTYPATVAFYDISNDQLVRFAQSTLPEKPVDVAISPDHTWVGVTGTSYVQVYDLTTGQLTLGRDTANDPAGYFPWCDGVELNNDHLVGWGYDSAQTGWVAVVDLFSQPFNYCTSGINSTGVGATLHATGSASITRNDLHLWSTGLPATAPGFFVYATNQASNPFGPGFVCVAGQRYKMPLAIASNGIATQAVDYNGPNALGGPITAGSTWNFQFRYRDVAAGGQLNLSDGLSVTFTN